MRSNPRISGFICIPLAVTMAAAVASHGAEVRYLAGWPVTPGAVHNSSLAVADVNGDGKDEIAVACWDGRLFLLDGRGRTLAGFPVNIGTRSASSSAPAIADLDNDGAGDVIVASDNGAVYAFDTRGAALPGWPQRLGAGARGVAVQDFTSYRGLEVFAAAGTAAYALHYNGGAVTGWPAPLDTPAAAMPAVGDLNGDGTPELVLAAGDVVYAYGTAGAVVIGWPVRLEGTITASPTIADLDGDGKAEVLIGTMSGAAYALDAEGRVEAGWPYELGPKPITTPAAVADLDGTGRPVAIFIGGATNLAGAVVAALDAGGRPRFGFPKQIAQTVAAAPLAADVDGDGRPEILIATYSGSLLAFEKNGALTSGFPQKLVGTGITATPAVGDIDGDGLLDIVVASQNGYVEAVSTGAAYERDANPWPMWGGDAWHTGKYFAPTASRQEFTLTSGRGEVTVRWEAAERAGRTGWAILRAVKDGGDASNVYAEIAAVDEQATAKYAYRDAQVEDGVVYEYKLEERLASGAALTYGPKSIRAVGAVRAESTIARCYPNPFSNQVNISYHLAGAGTATNVETVVAVYDISGKLLRTLVSEKQAPGEYIIEWDGTDGAGTPAASGVYLVSLRAGRNVPPSTKAVVLVR